MVRRGEKLREHILFTAKDLFLDLGFERVSMDAVAARAQTSKRSLYAHFDSKERLFGEVIEFVRGLVLDRLGMPSDYAADPETALVRFCARHLQVVFYRGSIQMCRMALAEADRFPSAVARLHDLLFVEAAARIADHIARHFNVSEQAAAEASDRLLRQLLFPRFDRTLFGVDQAAPHLPDEASAQALADAQIAAAVADALSSLLSRPIGNTDV